MTSKELFGKHFNGLHYEDITKERIQKYAIDFAKMHVEKALQEIYNSSIDEITSWEGNPYSGEGDRYLNLENIQKIYPLTNVK